ncbi:MAG: lysophospholipid acyltransferase family protein [Limimaricola soesokkakensis]|uniref:lysophospholipid acyltransferase family protein n=1 Tax=Limimaricola soesokkakensis TaxID=1343159 RepID=UPI0040598FA2
MSRPSDPEAARSPRMAGFFAGVMRRQLARQFRAVRIARPGLPALDPARPVMVVTNHPSWWDPAVFIALHDRLFPGRTGFGPIEAAMLEKYPFMARIGLFGVEEGPRGAAGFLRVAGRIVSRPDRVLWITAQGRFADPRERPLALRPGAAHLMARHPDLVALPLALDYPFWSEKRPEALLRFGAPLAVREGEPVDTLAARLEAALTEACDGLAARAVARDASAFDMALGGARGTGGVYGLWQRGRAVLAGRRFAADHGEEG